MHALFLVTLPNSITQNNTQRQKQKQKTHFAKTQYIYKTYKKRKKEGNLKETKEQHSDKLQIISVLMVVPY